ncbi:MAG: C40 family peptidase [Actinobacteria bacterium]|nr:C40 family peptidase [Actinomycetota bacterium]
MNPQTSARRGGRGGRRSVALLAAAVVLLLAPASVTSAAAAVTGGAASIAPTTTETAAPPATTEAPATEAPAAGAPTSTATAEPVAKLTRAQVKRLQLKLRVAPADGVLGPRTRAALRRFQARHHLTADGRPHPRVLALLRIPVRTPSTTVTAATPAPANVLPAIEAARGAIGAAYASGGNGPSAYDCSGLTTYAFGQAGITLPRTSYAQFEVGTEVPLTEIQAGDLVFFDTAGAGASHVGIATGPETAISATTHGVMEHPITTGYWGEHLIGARRVA